MKLALFDDEISKEEKTKIKSIFNEIKLHHILLNNIFMIITKGSYLLITLTFNLIEKLINKNNKSLDEKLLNEEIKQNKECLEHFLGDKIANYPSLVKNLYDLFKDLRENNIKFFIMYINDKSEDILDIYYGKKKSIKFLEING